MIGKRIWLKAIKPILVKWITGMGLIFMAIILLLAVIFYLLELIFRVLFVALDYFEVLRAFMRVERLFLGWSEACKAMKRLLLKFFVSFMSAHIYKDELEVVATVERDRNV